MNAIFFPLLLTCFLVRADDPPAPRIPLGKDTTYVTGPLDVQGYVDYESALNAELGRGVTPEKNAAALLIQVFGPAPEGGNGLPPSYFRWLDVPAPTKEGDYFLGMTSFARTRLAFTDAQLRVVFDQQSQAGSRPWSAGDYPLIAEWLKANEKMLALAVEATKRPEYFNPLVTNRKDGEQGSLIGALLPTVQRCRELTNALVARAMLRVQDGKFDDAWQDLLACHRLGRLVSRGGTLIEGLVGIAICQIASNSTLAYLEHVPLTAKQAVEQMKELRNLPPLGELAAKIDLTERLVGLESLQNVRRNGLGFLAALGDGEGRKPTPEELKALAELNWIPAMQVMNKGYNRMVAAMRLTDRTAREKEFDRLDEELRQSRKAAGDTADLASLLLKKGGPEKTAGKAIGDVLMALLTPAIRKIQGAHDRAEQVQRNLQIAFAMAAYHTEQGRYPAKLTDLAPTYLAAIPGDLFSGAALIYKPSQKGFLFYSVGPNGKDDGGRWYDDDPPGDDPGVRMPLPPLKKN